MADHSAVCFQWTGTYYNAVYNSSHTVVLRDDDANYEGHGDNDEKISVDGGAFKASQSQPYAIKVGFTDVNGDSKAEVFNFFQSGGKWYFIPGPESEFEVGCKLGNYQSHTTGWDYASAICFADGTMIDTGSGPVAVQDLQPGDLIRRAGGGLVPLRLNLARCVSARDQARHPGLVPVRIAAGALGDGVPRSDLRVSRQHRMMLRSGIARRMFGSREVLVAAHRLLDCPGVTLDRGAGALTYHHLVFDAHEVILANGAPSESLYPGQEALKSVPEDLRAELFAIFPDLAAATTVPKARPVPEPARQKALVKRHLQALKPFVQGEQALSRAG